MTRTTTIQTKYSDEVEDAVSRFADHEDMSAARVVKWLAQFTNADLPIALRVIAEVRYLNAVNIRALTKQLFQLTCDELKERGLRKAAFVPVGDGGSGSNTVARVLRNSLSGTRHKLLSMLDIAKLKPGAYDAIVFIDDFSATGDSLEKWWENVEPTIRPINAAVLVGLLLLNHLAYDRICTFAEEVVAVTELGPEADVLSTASTTFSDAAKPRILHYCRKTGIASKYEAGYGKCGLLVAFKHGCPNNSLPILWVHNRKWKSLFHRSAI